MAEKVSWCSVVAVRGHMDGDGWQRCGLCSCWQKSRWFLGRCDGCWRRRRRRRRRPLCCCWLLLRLGWPLVAACQGDVPQAGRVEGLLKRRKVPQQLDVGLLEFDQRVPELRVL